MKEIFKKVCEEELDRLKKVEQQLDELQDKCHFEPQTVEGEKTYVHIEPRHSWKVLCVPHCEYINMIYKKEANHDVFSIRYQL